MRETAEAGAYAAYRIASRYGTVITVQVPA